MLKSTIRDVQSLFFEQRVLSLALSIPPEGYAYAGLLPFIVDPDRVALLVRASKLARHARGLIAGARVCALIHEKDDATKDPLQLKRVTFECTVEPLSRDSREWIAARDRYVERFPSAELTVGLTDFQMYRLIPNSGMYVAGFGRAIALPPEDIVRLGEKL
jgi:putative heme iron utilization protein